MLNVTKLLDLIKLALKNPTPAQQNLATKLARKLINLTKLKALWEHNPHSPAYSNALLTNQRLLFNSDLTQQLSADMLIAIFLASHRAVAHAPNLQGIAHSFAPDNCEAALRKLADAIYNGFSKGCEAIKRASINSLENSIVHQTYENFTLPLIDQLIKAATKLGINPKDYQQLANEEKMSESPHLFFTPQSTPVAIKHNILMTLGNKIKNNPYCLSDFDVMTQMQICEITFEQYIAANSYDYEDSAPAGTCCIIPAEGDRYDIAITDLKNNIHQYQCEANTNGIFIISRSQQETKPFFIGNSITTYFTQQLAIDPVLAKTEKQFNIILPNIIEEDSQQDSEVYSHTPIMRC
jgi:hypothetical protein